jgi:hypothetical protein
MVILCLSSGYSIQFFSLCFSLSRAFKLSVGVYHQETVFKCSVCFRHQFKRSDGVYHYVQYSKVQIVFVITYSIQIISLCWSSVYNIQIVSWCLSLPTALKCSDGVSHYVHHSNGQLVIFITYSTQMFRWCLSLRTALKHSICVRHQVILFKFSDGVYHYVQHSNVQIC